MSIKQVEKEGYLGKEIYIEDPQFGGYTAYFEDFPKIVVQGEDIDEARINLWNAMYDVLKSFFNK